MGITGMNVFGLSSLSRFYTISSTLIRSWILWILFSWTFFAVSVIITKQHYSQKHVIIKRYINYLWLKKWFKNTNHISKIWYLWNEKEAVLRFCIMNDKKIIFILLKILDQIRQDNEEARNGIKRSSITICKEEGIYI